jgi:hypothetical protein
LGNYKKSLPFFGTVCSVAQEKISQGATTKNAPDSSISPKAVYIKDVSSSGVDQMLLELLIETGLVSPTCSNTNEALLSLDTDWLLQAKSGRRK